MLTTNGFIKKYLLILKNKKRFGCEIRQKQFDKNEARVCFEISHHKRIIAVSPTFETRVMKRLYIVN